MQKGCSILLFELEDWGTMSIWKPPQMSNIHTETSRMLMASIQEHKSPPPLNDTECRC